MLSTFQVSTNFLQLYIDCDLGVNKTEFMAYLLLRHLSSYQKGRIFPLALYSAYLLICPNLSLRTFHKILSTLKNKNFISFINKKNINDGICIFSPETIAERKNLPLKFLSKSKNFQNEIKEYSIVDIKFYSEKISLTLNDLYYYVSLITHIAIRKKSSFKLVKAVYNKKRQVTIQRLMRNNLKKHINTHSTVFNVNTYQEERFLPNNLSNSYLTHIFKVSNKSVSKKILDRLTNHNLLQIQKNSQHLPFSYTDINLNPFLQDYKGRIYYKNNTYHINLTNTLNLYDKSSLICKLKPIQPHKINSYKDLFENILDNRQLLKDIKSTEYLKKEYSNKYLLNIDNE